MSDDSNKQRTGGSAATDADAPPRETRASSDNLAWVAIALARAECESLWLQEHSTGVPRGKPPT